MPDKYKTSDQIPVYLSTSVQLSTKRRQGVLKEKTQVEETEQALELDSNMAEVLELSDQNLQLCLLC